MAYDRSCGTEGMASKSVDRTKKFPWNADMRRSVIRSLALRNTACFNQILTLGCTDTHNGFEHDGHSQHFAELVRELDRVLCTGSVEGRVKVRLSRGVMRKTC